MAKIIDFKDQPFETKVFEKMLRTMPVALRRNKRGLRFYCTTPISEDYVQAIAARMANQADQYLAMTGPMNLSYGGIPVVPCDDLPEGFVCVMTATDYAVPRAEEGMSVENFVATYEEQDGLVLAKGVLPRDHVVEPEIIELPVQRQIDLDNLKEEYDVD